jgi:hypothetical protein
MTKRKQTHHSSEAEEIMRKRDQQTRNIPSEEEFAQASAAMSEINKLFAEVGDTVLRSFSGKAPLHDLYFFGHPEKEVQVHVFYETERDIEACHTNGIAKQLEDTIRVELQVRSSDSTRSEITIIHDSHEKVKKVCNGNYLQYLR